MQEPNHTTKHIIFGGATILFLTLLVYWPAIDGTFLWDGKKVIPKNSMITEPGQLWKIWFSREPEDYWPISNTNYWIQWRLWGHFTLPYHVISVLLHAFNAILLWKILTRLKFSGAWIAALVFAVHPVNVESVAWIIQQKTLLATTFAFATVLHYLKHQRGHENSCDFTAVGLFFLSLLCKTSAVALPVFLLGIDWFRNGWNTRRMIRLFAPFFLLALVFGLVSIWYMQPQGVAVPTRTDGFLGRLAVAGWAVWFYLSKAIIPHHLMFVYPRWQVDEASILSYLPTITACSLLAVGWWKRHGWGKTLLAGWGCFVLSLVPVLGFADISFMRFSFVADHWQYMATAPIIALVVSLVFYATADWTKSRLPVPSPTDANFHSRQRIEVNTNRFCLGPISANIASVLVVFVIAAMSLLTWNRAHIFRHEFALWFDSFSKNPTAALVHNNLGSLYLDQANYSKAIKFYRAAVELDPSDVRSHVVLSEIYTLYNQKDEVIQHLEAALNVHPNIVKWNILLAKYLAEKGETEKAIQHYQRAIAELSEFSEEAKLLHIAIDSLQRKQKAK